MAGAIASDAASAMEAAGGMSLDFSLLQTALSNSQVLTNGTSAQAAASTAATMLVEEIGNTIAQQSTVIASPVPPSEPAHAIANIMRTKLASASTLASAAAVGGYLSRIVLNLGGGN